MHTVPRARGSAAVEVVGGVNNPSSSSLLLLEGRRELRAAACALRERGVDNPDELLRLAAAGVAKRYCDVFDSRDDVGPGWLAAAMRSAGAWNAPARPPRRETASDILRAINGMDS